MQKTDRREWKIIVCIFSTDERSALYLIQSERETKSERTPACKKQASGTSPLLLMAAEMIPAHLRKLKRLWGARFLRQVR